MWAHLAQYGPKVDRLWGRIGLVRFRLIRIHFACLNTCSNLPEIFFFTNVRGAASNSAYYGYPDLWILRYPAQRYHAVPLPGFEPTTTEGKKENPRC
jgi:hypothetical protein